MRGLHALYMRPWLTAPPTATDKWRVIPMDVEDAFATDSRDGYRNCAAEGYACKVRVRGSRIVFFPLGSEM